LEAYGNIDSKYRFIILAAKRAKQLLKGAKPKIQGKSKNPIRIAQLEVRSGLIEYEIIPTHMDEVPLEREERVFVGGGIPDESLEPESAGSKEPAEEGVEAEPGEEPEEEEAGEEEEAEGEDVPKDEKDD
jgi:DNA-directed RNA polymerase subunit omega